MREDLVDHISFICPKCRRAGTDGIVQHPLSLNKVFTSRSGFIMEGFLTCSNNECQARYPVIKGVPIILKDIAEWWRSEGVKLSCVSSDVPEMRDYFDNLQALTPADQADKNLLSSYMDFHYSKFCDSPAVFAEWANPELFWQTISEMTRPETGTRYRKALDMGCSVGRNTFELAGISDLVVGIDLNFSALVLAAQLQRGKDLRYQRRKRGRWFEEVNISYLSPMNVVFLAADALDPPFSPEYFDLVVSLNLLDNVRMPLTLIGQMNALLRQDGIFVIGSPYEWRRDICEPGEWLETEEMDAPEILRGILEGELFPGMRMKYYILQELEKVTWMIRHHDRYWSIFLLHIIRALKGNI